MQEIAYLDDIEVLKNFLLLAHERGYRYGNFIDRGVDFAISSFNRDTGRLVLVAKEDEARVLEYDRIYLIFFNLRFAEAIAGEQWETFLTELAESPDKISYIKRYLS